MDKCSHDMKKIKMNTKALKSKVDNSASLKWSEEFHQKAPTPQEVNKNEAIVKGWFDRAEKNFEAAKPAMEARD